MKTISILDLKDEWKMDVETGLRLTEVSKDILISKENEHFKEAMRDRKARFM